MRLVAIISPSINIVIKPSTIGLGLIILIFSTACLEIISFAYLGRLFVDIGIAIVALLCSYSLYRIWCSTQYHLTIMTNSKEVIISRNDHNTQLAITTVSLYRQFSFLLTVVKLKDINGKMWTLPVFIDSINLADYKTLRVFLQWN